MNSAVNPVQRIATMGDYVAILRRRWVYLATIIPAAILIAVFFAFNLPAIYESSATILLEPSSIPQELVKTTVVSYADQQIELVQRTVMTTSRLEPIVKEFDPYPNLTDISARDKARMIIGDTAIQKVDPVTLEPLMESSAFSIIYSNPDPQIAATVAQRLADMFLTYNRETRTAAAGDAYKFLLVKSNQLNAQIVDLEQKISVFKSKYGDALPENRTRNEGSLERSQRDVDASDTQIRILEQQESLLKLQLGQISPTLVATGTDVYTQLGQLRAELAAANQKYTPDHPDVKRLTRAIDALAAQAKMGNPANVRPDNPEYMRVESELQATHRNLEALRATAARARAQMADYERRITQTPGVERDYVQMERDRTIAQQQFAEIQAKLREAEIAQSLESESKGERYTQIRTPGVPSKPSSPNRLGVMLLGFILGGGLAVALAALRESSDPSVRSLNDLVDLADVPLIGAIPRLLNDADRRRKRLVWGSVAGAYMIATVLVAVSVVVH